MGKKREKENLDEPSASPTGDGAGEVEALHPLTSSCTGAVAAGESLGRLLSQVLAVKCTEKPEVRGDLINPEDPKKRKKEMGRILSQRRWVGHLVDRAKLTPLTVNLTPSEAETAMGETLNISQWLWASRRAGVSNTTQPAARKGRTPSQRKTLVLRFILGGGIINKTRGPMEQTIEDERDLMLYPRINPPGFPEVIASQCQEFF